MSIIILLFGHWFADFVMQTDDMAVNKSHSNSALAKHCLVYIFILIMFVYFTFPDKSLEFYNNVFAINLIGHLIIDFTTSRLNTWLWKKGMRHWFFVSIGFDQFLHIAILLWSVGLLK